MMTAYTDRDGDRWTYSKDDGLYHCPSLLVARTLAYLEREHGPLTLERDAEHVASQRDARKAPVYLDFEGDTWTLNEDDGLYHCPESIDPRSLESLRACLGPLFVREDAVPTPAVPTRPMTREEALQRATEHVNALAPGNADGVMHKAFAVTLFANFLIGEGTTDHDHR